MKISLRKAAALQSKLKVKISTITIDSELSFSIFANHTKASVNGETKKRREEMLASAELIHRIHSAIYEIRTNVGIANVTSGIHQLLSEKAFIDGFVGGQSSRRGAESIEPGQEIDFDTLARRCENARERAKSSNGYGASETISYFLQPIPIKDQSLRLVEINDKLLELNLSTKIELTDETVATLREVNLIEA